MNGLWLHLLFRLVVHEECDYFTLLGVFCCCETMVAMLYLTPFWVPLRVRVVWYRFYEAMILDLFLNPSSPPCGHRRLSFVLANRTVRDGNAIPLGLAKLSNSIIEKNSVRWEKPNVSPVIIIFVTRSFFPIAALLE